MHSAVTGGRIGAKTKARLARSQETTSTVMRSQMLTREEQGTKFARLLLDVTVHEMCGLNHSYHNSIN